MTDDEIEEALEELAEELDDILGLHQSKFRLSNNPKDTTMATATLPTSNMLGIELTLAEHFQATENEAAISEYASNHEYLRREGIALSAYVKGYRRDHGDYSDMPHKLSTALDKLQAAFGGVANLANPLASV